MLNIEKYKNEISRHISEYNLSLYSAVHSVMTDLNFKFSKKVYTEQHLQVLDWLCSEYKEPILNDKEKEYLSAVIKPFKDRVIYICKASIRDSLYQIEIYYTEEDGDKDVIALPTFSTDSMYKGMQMDSYYDLEELGLW